MTNLNQPEDHVDVLIVGAGPAGLMLANWMSRLGIKTRIVDKRSTKVFSGQADGLQCRTLEIFDSFDFADRAWRESNHMLEISSGTPTKTALFVDPIAFQILSLVSVASSKSCFIKAALNGSSLTPSRSTAILPSKEV